ncbi:MAG TPA: hypothetical protein PKZ99_15040, partial [Azospirillaceae bacterium]|nr:hypothetical protein [Azospirillaceae bacterium]
MATAVAIVLCCAPSVGWAQSDSFDTALLPPPPVMTVAPHATTPHATAPHTSPSPYKSEKKHAESAAPTPDAPPRGMREWWMEKRDILGDAPDMAR